MKINAAEESFELMELFGKTVLFTNMRVDRSTVSAVAAGGLYALNNNKWEKITDFSDNDFSTQYIREVEMVSEEEFVILLNSDGQGVKLRLLTQRDISEIQQKKIIQIALTYGGNTDPYTNLIKKYNSDRSKYIY